MSEKLKGMPDEEIVSKIQGAGGKLTYADPHTARVEVAYREDDGLSERVLINAGLVQDSVNRRTVREDGAQDPDYVVVDVKKGKYNFRSDDLPAQFTAYFERREDLKFVGSIQYDQTLGHGLTPQRVAVNEEAVRELMMLAVQYGLTADQIQKLLGNSEADEDIANAAALEAQARALRESAQAKVVAVDELRDSVRARLAAAGCDVTLNEMLHELKD